MFLRHMNRVLVGTMLEVASGRRAISRSSRSCSRAAPRRGGPDGAGARAGAGARVLRSSLIFTRQGPKRPLCWTQAMLNVLLTNDDGIEADGLQALRRALRGARRRAPGGDRARRQPLGDGALDHDAPAAVGRRGAVRRRHDRLRDRRHAGRLRAPGEPRPRRGLRGRPGRRGHQPRREPGRRHHLLGHRRGGARGRRAGAARDRRLPAVAARAHSTTASTAASTSRSPRRSSRVWSSASRRCRCRRGRC